jgi:hypothetical protein
MHMAHHWVERDAGAPGDSKIGGLAGAVHKKTGTASYIGGGERAGLLEGSLGVE